MNLRTAGAGALLVSATLLLASPVAHADTGSLDFLGPSGSGGGINLGCLLQSLSGESPTADCDPPTIPAP
ncbi:hypothetical protein ACWF9G_20720 [Nocardia sp. NPDC055029]